MQGMPISSVAPVGVSLTSKPSIEVSWLCRVVGRGGSGGEEGGAAGAGAKTSGDGAAYGADSARTFSKEFLTSTPNLSVTIDPCLLLVSIATLEVDAALSDFLRSLLVLITPDKT